MDEAARALGAIVVASWVVLLPTLVFKIMLARTVLHFKPHDALSLATGSQVVGWTLIGPIGVLFLGFNLTLLRQIFPNDSGVVDLLVWFSLRSPREWIGLLLAFMAVLTVFCDVAMLLAMRRAGRVPKQPIGPLSFIFWVFLAEGTVFVLLCSLLLVFYS